MSSEKGFESGLFQSTDWKQVSAAADSNSPEFPEALEALCSAYWYPLYAYARRMGASPPEAQDYTQGFFEQALLRDFFKRANQNRGKFRAFLMGSMKIYIMECRRNSSRIKRGGGAVHYRIDWSEAESSYRRELTDESSPEALFDRNWALAIIDIVIVQLQKEYAESGEADRFEAMRFVLEDPGAVSYEDLASQLDITVLGARSAVHRLRQRFRSMFRREVARTLDNPADVDREIQHLQAAMT